MNNNLKKMKENIISQIQAMDVEKFEKLVDLFQDYDEYDLIDVSELFVCNKCREKYGECDDIISKTCSERFKKYALSNE